MRTWRVNYIARNGANVTARDDLEQLAAVYRGMVRLGIGGRAYSGVCDKLRILVPTLRRSTRSQDTLRVVLEELEHGRLGDAVRHLSWVR